MFQPNWRYTDNIVKNLTFISEARAIVLNAPLVPKWEVSLRRDALLRSAHSSTAIEGNPLTMEEVSELAAGREVMVARKDRQEVLNYLQVLEQLAVFAKKTRFQSEDLLAIHKRVTKGTLENSDEEGAFRKSQVFVGNARTGKVVFMPPSSRQVPKLVDEFLTWLNSPGANDIDPVLQAGIAHYELVRIHPFIDGNGRTARVLATLMLYRRGFDVKRFFTLDDYYDNDRPGYYAALKAVDQKNLDLTGWLDYFTGGVAVSLKVVKEKVIGLSRDIKFLKDKGQVALTERQMKIVERAIQNNQVTVGELAQEFGISRQAGLKEMNKLVELGVVRLVGKGRGAHYVLA
ncbi:MAG: Fic family protein [Actinobacteria bacterium]|nr:Fic family protein [Actinomycetota bacterium]